MRRVERYILIVTFAAFSWLMMQVVHEVGHIIAAKATGAEIIKVYLHPLVVSSTDVWDPPKPLVVVWSGPIAGMMLPLIALGIARISRCPGLYLFRFFAGFCLIVNGVYIAFGPSTGGADSAVMIEHGTPRWAMVLFGLCTAPLGLYLWHRQGPYFGLGETRGRVDRHAVVTSTLLLGLVVCLELIFGHRQ
ncbi:MAG: hypothetical protein HUU46_08810 [Candidatus Hydrogenedentes bacterium]|nr:hypothetical protein [Candidatus Hydrogenedentota bacterium]